MLHEFPGSRLFLELLAGHEQSLIFYKGTRKLPAVGYFNKHTFLKTISRSGASEYFSDDPLSENFSVTLVLFIKVMLPFDPRSLWLSRNSG